MKEKNEKYILYVILILVTVGLVLAFTGFSFSITKSSDSNVKTNSVEELGSIETGTTNVGDVSVELTPQKVANGELKVDISVNTHSVDLSQFDLKQITTLEYGGKIIKPITVPRLQGHHSSGTIVFDVVEEIDNFTIKIKGIPKVEERIFRWG